MVSLDIHLHKQKILVIFNHISRAWKTASNVTGHFRNTNQNHNELHFISTDKDFERKTKIRPRTSDSIGIKRFNHCEKQAGVSSKKLNIDL